MTVKETFMDGLDKIRRAIFYQEELKKRARSIIEETALGVQLKIDTGMVDSKILMALATDKDQKNQFESLYKSIFWSRKSRGPLIETMDLDPTTQTALLLRHAEYLRRRWFPEDEPIRLNLSEPPSQDQIHTQ